LNSYHYRLGIQGVGFKGSDSRGRIQGVGFKGSDSRGRIQGVGFKGSDSRGFKGSESLISYTLSISDPHHALLFYRQLPLEDSRDSRDSKGQDSRGQDSRGQDSRGFKDSRIQGFKGFKDSRIQGFKGIQGFRVVDFYTLSISDHHHALLFYRQLPLGVQIVQ
jgi:hypothetical protein